MYQCRLEAPAAHRPCTPAGRRHARVRACSHCDRSVSPRHRRSPRGGCLLAAQRHSDAQHACTWRSIHAAGARRSRATARARQVVIRHKARNWFGQLTTSVRKVLSNPNLSPPGRSWNWLSVYLIGLRCQLLRHKKIRAKILIFTPRCHERWPFTPSWTAPSWRRIGGIRVG